MSHSDLNCQIRDQPDVSFLINCRHSKCSVKSKSSTYYRRNRANEQFRCSAKCKKYSVIPDSNHLQICKKIRKYPKFSKNMILKRMTSGRSRKCQNTHHQNKPYQNTLHQNTPKQENRRIPLKFDNAISHKNKTPFYSKIKYTLIKSKDVCLDNSHHINRHLRQLTNLRTNNNTTSNFGERWRSQWDQLPSSLHGLSISPQVHKFTKLLSMQNSRQTEPTPKRTTKSKLINHPVDNNHSKSLSVCVGNLACSDVRVLDLCATSTACSELRVQDRRASSARCSVLRVLLLMAWVLTFVAANQVDTDLPSKSLVSRSARGPKWWSVALFLLFLYPTSVLSNISLHMNA